ncbi:MAG: EAL domain-containing protein [Nitrospiria bacterium]
MSIRNRLFLTFICAFMVPILALGFVSYFKAGKELREGHLKNLEVIADLKVEEIETFFREKKNNITSIQGDPTIINGLPVLDHLMLESENPGYQSAKKALDRRLRPIQTTYGFFDVMLVNTKGIIVYTSNESHAEGDIGNKLPDPDNLSFREGVKGVYISKPFSDPLEDDLPVIILSAPLRNDAHDLIGVIAIEVDMAPIYHFIQDVKGLGHTGETLVGTKSDHNVLFINPPRHEGVIPLETTVRIGSETALPMQEAVQGRSGFGLSHDYRDQETLAVWRYISGLDWGMVAKIDTKEAFESIATTRRFIFVIGLLALFFGGVVLSSTAESITKPLDTLKNGIALVSKGDLDHPIKVETGGEIAILSEDFNRMINLIKEQNKTLEKNKLTKNLFELGDDVRMIVGSDWDITQINQEALEQLFGYQPEEVIGKSFDVLFDPESGASSGLGSKHFESMMIRKDGSAFEADLYWANLETDEGEMQGALITIRDISYIKKRQKELDQTLQRLSDMKYAIDESSIVSITDPKGNIQYVNDNFCAASKYSREELVGQNHRLIKSEIHSDRFFKAMWETISRGQVWKGELKNKAKDGSFYWVDSTIVPFLDKKRKPYQYLAIRYDITPRKEKEEKIRHMAQYDELTGLPNRNLHKERLGQALKQRKKHPLAVMFIDLDRFKHVNDTLGHSAGDQLLKEVAKRLLNCLRESDTVARIGGDEFTILLPEIAQSNDIHYIARRILSTLEKPYHIQQNELFVTCSIGISVYPEDGETSKQLLKYADMAMYCAKRNGKNQYAVYSSTLKNDESELKLESALRHALEREEFLLHYQPLINLKSGKIIGMEALIRWKRKGGELIPPFKFIPLAEETGLILDIGYWVIASAAKQLKAWEVAGFTQMAVSVNVSAPQFKQPKFSEEVAQIIETTEIRPGELKLEMTESLLMHNHERTIETLQKLRNLGVHFSIDDFGTGYSSLSYLKRFPVECLKIDRSFIKNLPGDQDDSVIARTIITLAHNLGLSVVAEGIETKDQLAFLQEHGCNIGQGYLFSRPLPVEAFTLLLEKNASEKRINTNLFDDNDITVES